MTTSAHFMQVLHTVYIPARPRRKDGDFKLVFLKVMTGDKSESTKFVVDVQTDEPIDTADYEEWVLESVRNYSLEALQFLALEVKPADVKFSTSVSETIKTGPTNVSIN